MTSDRNEVAAFRAARKDAITAALIDALFMGIDVAELIVTAAVAAEKAVAKTDQSILDNRSGSWEAGLLGDMLRSGGAYLDDETGQ